MAEDINIGDTVEVYVNATGHIWRGEVVDFVGEDADAWVQCIVGDVASGISPHQRTAVPQSSLTRWGDPEGMRADGCDDVDVTGRVRPYHRHAVTGKAHAHPGGGLPHTHQIAATAAGLVQALPPDDHSLRDALAEPVTVVEDGGLLPYEVRRQRMAHLLVRQAMALDYEGIGPMTDEDTDAATLAGAVALVRSEFADHELWDHSLLSDDQHTGTGCDRCERRSRS
jgi:hypothetical protein